MKPDDLSKSKWAPHSKMGTDVYDIFSGTSEKDAVWREDVVGIDRAKERMQQLAAAQPGNYFVFHTETQAIVAKISTALKDDEHPPKASSAR